MRHTACEHMVNATDDGVMRDPCTKYPIHTRCQCLLNQKKKMIIDTKKSLIKFFITMYNCFDELTHLVQVEGKLNKIYLLGIICSQLEIFEYSYL